jgi:hypothetical protein
MGSFDWNQAGEDSARRYANVDDGDVDEAAVGAWETFVGALGRGTLPAWQAAYSTFVLAVANRQRITAAPRVFVSHRHADRTFAEQIAWQASQAGKDYWLDLHDAMLQLADQTIPPQHPLYALIIAAIIEMALLAGPRQGPPGESPGKRQAGSIRPFSTHNTRPRLRASTSCWPIFSIRGRKSIVGSARDGVLRRGAISARPTRRRSSSTRRAWPRHV